MPYKTSDWPSHCLEIVARNIPDLHETVLLGQSSNSEYQIEYPIPEDLRMVISYNSSKKFFIAWNIDIHRYIHSGINYKLNIPPERHRSYSLKKDEIKPIYVERRQRSDVEYQTRGYEKILLIGTDALAEFCRNYEDYLYPHPDDQSPDGTLLFASKESELVVLDLKSEPWYHSNVVRARDVVSRMRRDPTFKKRVLERYNSRCVICGSTELKILQAAHKQAVQYGGDDSTDNGVCLCANHHRLYDEGLLDIDWSNNTFSCRSTSEKHMPWYQAAKERNFNLHIDKA